MELTKIIHQLHHQGEAILSLCAPLSDVQAQWKPNAESWSVLQVLNHLLKEEKRDFRRHLGAIFNEQREKQTENDSDKRDTSLAADKLSLEQTMLEFKSERETSIVWLNALRNPNWSAVITFEWGSLSAGDLLVSWTAHDLLHLRQLVALTYQHTNREAKPFDTAYAGKW